jgi:hypothetical protein
MRIQWPFLLLAALVFAGCEETVVSQYVPVPLPVQPAPPTMFTVVGTGATPEQARQDAIDKLVHKVILPPTEPKTAPPAEFVEALIRGYNVKSTEKTLTGTYYVTLQLTVNQVGTNFQELYEKSALQEKETVLLKDKVEDEKAHRQIAEEKQKAAEKAREADTKANTERILQLEQELDRLSHEAKRPEPTKGN